jgi:hypothetical protein
MVCFWREAVARQGYFSLAVNKPLNVLHRPFAMSLVKTIFEHSGVFGWPAGRVAFPICVQASSSLLGEASAAVRQHKQHCSDHNNNQSL